MAAIASSVRTPGVCHSKRPPLSTASRILTRSWHAVRITTRGRTQSIQAREFRPLANRFLAPRYIPQPDIVTKSGAAIPPNAAATKAAGWPTVIPSGGRITAVWTSIINRIAIAFIWSIQPNLIHSPNDFSNSRFDFYRVFFDVKCRGNGL